MIIESEDDRIVLRPETIEEGYRIGKLSRAIGCSVMIHGEDVSIDFNHAEIFELLRLAEEGSYAKF